MHHQLVIYEAISTRTSCLIYHNPKIRERQIIKSWPLIGPKFHERTEADQSGRLYKGPKSTMLVHFAPDQYTENIATNYLNKASKPYSYL